MRTGRLARVTMALCLVGAVVTFAVTFALTEQTPEETTALSQGVEEQITSTAPPGGSGAGAAASEGQETGFVERLLAVADIRAWAHVPEFLLQGLFLLGAAELWPEGWPGGWRGCCARYGVALLVCAGCSLFDQVHKAFVPGREFDARDLLFDALGYLLAMAVVLIVSAIARAVGRRRERLGERV